MHVTTEQLFTEARTQNGYLDHPVSDDTLHQLYELVKWGPTAANCCPARPKVDNAFWSGTQVRTSFVCTLGKGDPAQVWPRNPRLPFEEACSLV